MSGQAFQMFVIRRQPKALFERRVGLQMISRHGCTWVGERSAFGERHILCKKTIRRGNILSISAKSFYSFLLSIDRPQAPGREVKKKFPLGGGWVEISLADIFVATSLTGNSLNVWTPCPFTPTHLLHHRLYLTKPALVHRQGDE